MASTNAVQWPTNTTELPGSSASRQLHSRPELRDDARMSHHIAATVLLLYSICYLPETNASTSNSRGPLVKWLWLNGPTSPHSIKVALVLLICIAHDRNRR
jgi:hypothetical protein